jgi:hypothetical protein
VTGSFSSHRFLWRVVELEWYIFRLYFTTFPHPPPNPQALNRSSAEPGNQPRVRARPRGGPSASPDDNATYYYFTIDDQLLYLSFFQDWGPLNIAMVYKACILIHELLEVCSSSKIAYDTCHSHTYVLTPDRTRVWLLTDWSSTLLATREGRRMRLS